MKLNVLCGIRAVVAALLVAPAAVAVPTAEEICKTGTWANCGIAVQAALDAKPADPKAVLSLALAWGRAYDAQFDALRKAGRLDKSTPDSAKIYDEVKSHLDPVQIATDKAVDVLVKKYLPRVAVLLEWANKPLVEALKVFFDSSEIASDRDELDLMNDRLQAKIAQLLEPHLTADWKQKLQRAATSAGPQLRRQ